MNYRLVNKGETIKSGDEVWMNGAWRSSFGENWKGDPLVTTYPVRRRATEGAATEASSVFTGILDELRKNTQVNEESLELAKDMIRRLDDLQANKTSPRGPQSAQKDVLDLSGMVDQEKLAQGGQYKPEPKFSMPKGEWRLLSKGEIIKADDEIVWTSGRGSSLPSYYAGMKAGTANHGATPGWSTGYGESWAIARKLPDAPEGYRKLAPHEIVKWGDSYLYADGKILKATCGLGQTAEEATTGGAAVLRKEWTATEDELPPKGKLVTVKDSDGNLYRGAFISSDGRWNVIRPSDWAAYISTEGTCWKSE